MSNKGFSGMRVWVFKDSPTHIKRMFKDVSNPQYAIVAAESFTKEHQESLEKIIVVFPFLRLTPPKKVYNGVAFVIHKEE